MHCSTLIESYTLYNYVHVLLCVYGIHCTVHCILHKLLFLYIFYLFCSIQLCFFFLIKGLAPPLKQKKKRRKSKKKKEKYTALSAVNTKFTSTILFSTLACIGGPFLHSSLVFNGCAVDFLTCTQHSENHADPLVQSLTISNSKTKLEAAVWSNTRTFYGYSTFSHAIVNTQTPMVWSGKIISQRTKLTQTSLIARPIHM